MNILPPLSNESRGGASRKVSFCQWTDGEDSGGATVVKGTENCPERQHTILDENEIAVNRKF